MSSSNCCFLTCIQISQEAGQVVWYPHLFQNFPQFIVIHTVKCFGIVNKAEIDVLLDLSCFFHDPANVGDLISGSSAYSNTSLNIWKFMVHVLLKPGLEKFEHYFTSVWDEWNCAVVWAFFCIAFLWNWNENWPFPVYVHFMTQIVSFQSDIFSCKLPRLSAYHFPGTDSSGGAMARQPGRDLPQRLTALPSSFPLSVWGSVLSPQGFCPGLERDIKAVHP